MNPIPYQPLPVDFRPNCTMPQYGGWIQLIELSDLTQVQFTIDACASFMNMVLNPTFVSGSTNWNPSGTWDFSGNKACSAVGSNDYIQQNFTLPNGYILQLVVDVEMFAGVVAVSTNLGLIGLLTTTGETTIAFNSNGVTNINFFVNSNSAACLRNIRLKAINTRFRVDLQTPDGDTVTPDIAATFSVTRNFLTVSFDWNTLLATTGCYRLAFFDPCQCDQFGFMGDDFIIGGGATSTQIILVSGEGGVPADGTITAINTTGAASQSQFRKTNVICPNVAYTFTYTVTGLNAGDDFQLRAGIANGTTRATDGTYTDVLTSAHSGELPSDLRWIFDFPADNLTGVTITDFSMEAVEPTPSYATVPFKLIDDGSCTMYFNACGDRDQFNMGFPDTGFSPKIRLEGTLRGNGYDGERTGYEFSAGKRIVTHLRTRKLFEFGFRSPEYVHDFMQLLRGFDNTYVNDIAAYAEDSEYPSISLDKDVDMGGVVLRFSNRTELTENVRTDSTSSGGCTVRGNNLLTTNGNRSPTGFNVQGTKTPFQTG